TLMDFALNDDQLELQRSVREFLESRYPLERVAQIADGSGWERGAWDEVCELGWTAISVPEERGGLGLSFLEEALVLEQLGAALFPGPYLSTVALALPALAGAPDLEKEVATGTKTATLAWAGADGELRGSDLAVVAERSGSDWRLSGTAMFVPDLAAIDVI